MFSLKSFLAASALIASVVSPDAHAEWKVGAQLDEWNRPTDNVIAVSPTYVPDPRTSGTDAMAYMVDYTTTIRARYNPGGVIPYDCEMNLIFLKDPDLIEVELGGESSPLLQVIINNKETVAIAAKIAPKVFTLIGKENEFDAVKLAQADSLKMIIPHKKGNHLVEFDMTGAKRAIAEVCKF